MTRLLSAVAGVVLLACTLRAGAIYDNTAARSSGTDPVESFGPLYDSFIPDATGNISGLALILKETGSPTGAIDIGLYADSATSPGALITSLGTLNDSDLSSALATYTVTLISNPTVNAGVRYWIGLSGTTSADWSWSSDGTGPGVANEFFANADGVFLNNPNGPYQMDLTTDAVPEPASAAFVVLGLAAAYFVSRRQT
jgi:hypothetical protein